MNNILVTGLGAVSTAGFTLDSIWRTLYEGRITYGPIPELLDRSDFRIKIGAKIDKNDWAENVSDKILKKYGKTACYSVSAALRAINDAEIDLSKIDKKRVSVVIGTTMGEIEAEEKITESLAKQDVISDKLYRQVRTVNIINAVAEATGIQGYMYTIPSACAAGNYAVAIGKQLLEWNYSDVVLAGGADSFSKVSFAGFQRLLSLTPDFCRPFDKDRKGLVIGEVAGIVVMERAGIRNNQKNYGSVLGCGLASNAYHMTSPHKDGQGELEAMEKAVRSSGLALEDIDYISAHGTGTRANDRIETLAIKRLYGNIATPPVSSIKSVLGHSMGAASILELIASFLMIQNQTILPTMNCITKDSDCSVDIVQNNPRKCNLRYIMSNSFAFGGQTSSVIIGS